MEKKKLHDDELGIITVVVNPRAKRYILKIKGGAVFGVIPPGGSEEKLMLFLNMNRLKLIAMLKKQPVGRGFLSDTTDLQTHTFKLNIFRTQRDNFHMTLQEGVLHIACPQETRFEDTDVQHILKTFLEKALQHEAKRLLPERLQTLAKQHAFIYSGVRISKSKTRWGSCNSKRKINLSFLLLLLPDELIDYVLLHELCHTRVMNHSSLFWKLMDEVTGNKALALDKKLNQYNIR
jgi:predicted metal-dependent hydrolase